VSSSHDDVSELSPQQLQALADRLLRQRKAMPVAAANIPEGTPAALSYAQEALWSGWVPVPGRTTKR